MVFGDLTAGEVNVRIWIHPDYRKHGYGTAALRKSRSEMAAYFPAVPLVVRAPAAGLSCAGREFCMRAAQSPIFTARVEIGAPPRNWGLKFVTSASMATSVTRVAGLLTVAAVVATVNACTPAPNGPEPTAKSSSPLWRRATPRPRPSSATARPSASQALNEAWAGLQATQLDAQILGSKYAEDTGSITYRYTWHLPKTGPGPTTGS